MRVSDCVDCVTTSFREETRQGSSETAPPRSRRPPSWSPGAQPGPQSPSAQATPMPTPAASKATTDFIAGCGVGRDEGAGCKPSITAECTERSVSVGFYSKAMPKIGLQLLCQGNYLSLGDGKSLSRSLPGEIYYGGWWTTVAAGARHTCAIRVGGGGLWCVSAPSLSTSPAKYCMG